MTEKPHPTRLGRYEIVRELGKGAMGVVYEGRDPNINRRVAIKTARRDVMEASGMADEMMVRFLREAQAAGALNHPNIITIYDAGEEEGVAYIAMEFIEGGDLRDQLASKRRLSCEEIVEMGATLCEALAVAHEVGIVHRDIKPANIMILKNGSIKIADFGIAHVSDSNLTQEGALIGTPHYMSPEQFMGQKLDGRSDLFSVGNILYELITGEKPFTGEALSTVMHHVIKTDPVPPHEFNLTIPDPLSQVVMKALAKRPAQRYANGRAMAAALRECLKEHPNPAILEGRTGSAAETVMSASTPDAGGTVIAPVPGPGSSGSATVVSATGTGGAADSSAMDATAPATPMTPPVPDVMAGRGEFSSRKLMMAGAAVAVLVFSVTLISLMRGGNEVDGAAPGAGPAITPGNSFMLDVRTARDAEAYLEFIEVEESPKEVRDPVFERLVQSGALVMANGTVTVSNPETGTRDAFAIEDGQVLVSVSGEPDRLSLEVVVDGYNAETCELLRNPAGKWENSQIVLNKSE